MRIICCQSVKLIAWTVYAWRQFNNGDDDDGKGDDDESKGDDD